MAHRFKSRDPIVRGIIAGCEAKFTTNGSHCRALLECILNKVDVSYQARWSAGASILAFIPTILILTSNSIDEVVLVAEESPLLAFFLCFCSVTVFNTRLVAGREINIESESAVREDLEHALQTTSSLDTAQIHSRKRQRTLVPGFAIVALLGCAAAVWYPTHMIWRQGTVVFSCPVRAYVPVWVALFQLTAAFNVLVRSVTRTYTEVPTHHTPAQLHTKARERSTTPSAAERDAGPSATQVWSEKVLLRTYRATMLSYALQLFTSILSFALYTYSTAVLASITMFPASDALRCLAMYAVSAGAGRLIANAATLRHGRWKRTLVYDVSARNEKAIATTIRATIDGRHSESA